MILACSAKTRLVCQVLLNALFKAHVNKSLCGLAAVGDIPGSPGSPGSPFGPL